MKKGHGAAHDQDQRPDASAVPLFAEPQVDKVRHGRADELNAAQEHAEGERVHFGVVRQLDDAGDAQCTGEHGVLGEHAHHRVEEEGSERF